MTNEVRPASDSLIALIQPFVDDELGPAERARVEAQLAADPVLREMVEEQVTVRLVLRDMPQEPAPQALSARVLLELDAVDRELAAAKTPAIPAREPAWRRFRSFMRGAAVMVPAGATALALFLVTRTGTERHVAEASSAAPATPATSAGILGDASMVLGAAPSASPGVRLVGAPVVSDIDDDRGQPVVVEHQVGPRRVLDRHEPAGGKPPSQGREYRGHRYWLGQVAGRPAVAFESDGVRHTLTREDTGFRDDREYMFLLALGHALQDAER